jgi:GntR family transcriptional regulator
LYGTSLIQAVNDHLVVDSDFFSIGPETGQQPHVMARSFRYQEIAEAIRTEVTKGALVAGALLPSESELSAEHAVSRVTVRKALEQLRAEGLVDSRQGFGWFVGSEPIRQSLDGLETIEDQLAEAGRSSERRVLRFGFVAAAPEVALLLDTEVLEVVRLNLADAEPFAHITVWCKASLGADLSSSDVEESTFVDLLSDRLGHATQVISAVAADPAAAAALHVDEGAPLLRVRRVTTDVAGGNALVSEHLYPAHRTEFEVTLSGPTGEPAGLRLVE